MADVKLTAEDRVIIRSALANYEASLKRGLTKAQQLGRNEYGSVIERDVQKLNAVRAKVDAL